MLSISHLYKEYDSETVLDDVNLTVGRGQVVCIIGPSGSGKSTLLRCINYLEQPTKGVVTFDGSVVGTGSNQIKILRQRVGMVFQDFNLFELKNVLTNITLAPVLTKIMSKDDAKAEAVKLLNFVGLNDKVYSMPDTLSGGEKQRVAIARSLAMHPEMLLLDEPTSALDPELVQEVLKVIRSLANQKTTMIIVTHQLKFAMDIADKIVFMEKGRIVEEGSPSDIMTNPKEPRTREYIQSVANLEGDLNSGQTDFY